MSRSFVVTAVAVAFALALVAFSARRLGAQLEHGAPAPEFSAPAALGGTVGTFDLKHELAKGPVVLYFYPKSFTSGCTVEAHLFSEAIPAFAKLGATVVGVSGQDIETQKRFSTQACGSAFRIASDPGLKIAKQYDAALGGEFSNRTSYVIAPDGTIAYAYTSMDPSKHVANTLAALRKLEAAK